MDLVIRGGTLITSEGRQEIDLCVSGGKIAEIGSGLQGKEVIDARGMYVIPGGVDPHVHLEMDTGVTRSSDDWVSGTKAAAFGGTTTVIDFVEQRKGQSLLEAAGERREQADGRTVIDYALHMTLDNMRSETIEDIPKVVRYGISSFKVYTTYGLMLNDGDLYDALTEVNKAGGLLIVHAENDTIVKRLQKQLIDTGHKEPYAHPLAKPAEIEGEAVERVLAYAEANNAPVYIVHVSSQRGADAITRAKARGQKVFGETCPQYLVLTDVEYSRPNFEGAKFVCSPPLRKPEDNVALWKSLASDILQTVGTDHCPFFFKGQKEIGRELFTKIPGGIPGIESRLAILYSYGVMKGMISLERWVEVCCSNPAKLFGLFPGKGSLLPGADADIVLFDPNKKIKLTQSQLHENVDYTPYEGLQLEGYPVLTIRRGEILVRDGQYIGQGKGLFQPCGLPNYS